MGGIFELSENSPILETVKILWQDKAVNKKEFPEECAREREIMGQDCIKCIEEVGEKCGRRWIKKWDRKEFNLAPPTKIVYSLLVFEY